MTEHDTLLASVLPTINEVAACWRRNGLKQSSSVQYQQWVRRYLSDCARKHTSPLIHLTAVEVQRLAENYARRRKIDCHEACQQAQQALKAWSIGLESFGVKVPTWSVPKVRRQLSGPWFKEYRVFRNAHSSAQNRTVNRDLKDIAEWLRYLRTRKRRLPAVRVSDIDAYVLHVRRRLAVATVARILTSLRLFLRFLHTTGRIRYDLASLVQCPARRSHQMPRALCWADVQKLLRAVDRRTLTGQRDYTILLLMSLYGLGSAEIIGLTLDNIHWAQLTLDVVRPKTGVEIKLPLLPAAARALARYLREGRPPDAPTRTVFVRRKMPHIAFTSSAIRFAIRRYARKAGIRAPVLGGHVLRHSHAARQIDLKTPPES